MGNKTTKTGKTRLELARDMADTLRDLIGDLWIGNPELLELYELFCYHCGLTPCCQPSDPMDMYMLGLNCSRIICYVLDRQQWEENGGSADDGPVFPGFLQAIPQ